MEYTKVINSNGSEIYYDVSVLHMDYEIREKLANEIAPCTEQEFFEAYAKAHKETFGVEWYFDTENPVY